MIIEGGGSDVKPFRQGCYVDFYESVAVDGVLQDELAGGVVDADGLELAVEVGEIELVSDGVRIDAELQRFVVVYADMGSVGFVEVGDTVAEFGVRIIVKVAAFADHLHHFRRGVVGHGLPQTGTEASGNGCGQAGAISLNDKTTHTIW